MTRILITRARQALPDVVSHVASRGECVVLSRNGRDLAAIVPMDLYRLSEQDEDRQDVAEMHRRKRAAAARGARPIPYQRARKRLGLVAKPAIRRSTTRRRK